MINKAMSLRYFIMSTATLKSDIIRLTFNMDIYGDPLYKKHFIKKQILIREAAKKSFLSGPNPPPLELSVHPIFKAFE